MDTQESVAEIVRRAHKSEYNKALYYRTKAKRTTQIQAWRRANYDKVLSKSTRWNLAHPEKRKEIKLKKLYGLTLADFNEMLVAQNGVCAICREPSSKTLSVDHCHKTGVIRGLLCSNCNRGIGFLKDSQDILFSALNYLNKICKTTIV